MLVLVMTVCLGALQCHEERVLFPSNRAPTTCVVQAPIVIAEWLLGHEGWKVERWTCESFTEDNQG